MGFPGLDEGVKFNVMKHLAKCCTADQRPVVDTKIKQEMAHVPIAQQDTRIEPIRSQEGKLDQTRQDSKIESLRCQDIVIDPPISIERSNLITSTTQSNPLESKTVIEKRLMYQQLLSRTGTTRKVTSPNSRMSRSQYAAGAFEYRTDDQKLQQLSPNVKSTSKYPTILPWSNNSHTGVSITETLKNSTADSSVPWINSAKIYTDNNNNTRVNLGLKMPQVCKSDGNLIKPVPQMPDKYLVSGGIRLMPATVLVPVQVGYAPLDGYKQRCQTDDRERARDVWRPWERVDALNSRSKGIHNQSIFSL